MRVFFKVVAVDYNEDVEHITMIEAFDYPMYAFAFHPEYHSLEFQNHNKLIVKTDSTGKEIIKNYSNFFYKEATKNTNSF